MRTVGRVLAGLATAAVVLPALAGCGGEPAYRFISNDSHDAVMRVPSAWDRISVDAAMRAAGQKDTATQGWLAFYDGDGRPSALHATAAHTEAPVLMARSVDIPEESRAQITDDALRDILFPVTEAGRAQEQLSTGVKLPAFSLMKDRTVTTKTARGVHVLFSYTTAGRTEVYDQVVVTDPDRTRIHLVMVHCSKNCFSSRGTEIDRVVSSLTVKKT